MRRSEVTTKKCDSCGLWFEREGFDDWHDPYCTNCMEESYSKPYWRDELESQGYEVLVVTNPYDVRRYLEEKQRGRCAICKRAGQKLVIDHDHATGLVRGLLCQNCNFGLGNFEDNIQRLEESISYLSESRRKPSRIRYADAKKVRRTKLHRPAA